MPNLKAVLTKLRLPLSGTKAALVERLLGHIQKIIASDDLTLYESVALTIRSVEFKGGAFIKLPDVKDLHLDHIVPHADEVDIMSHHATSLFE